MVRIDSNLKTFFTRSLQDTQPQNYPQQNPFKVSFGNSLVTDIFQKQVTLPETKTVTEKLASYAAPLMAKFAKVSEIVRPVIDSVKGRVADLQGQISSVYANLGPRQHKVSELLQKPVSELGELLKKVAVK